MAVNRTGVSSGQEAPKILHHCVVRVQHYCAFHLVNNFNLLTAQSKVFNDMDQTRCPMLLLPIVRLHLKKKLQ